MADLHPFRAVRPTPDAITEVCSAPYDVVSTQEARQLALGRSRSFFRVIRPEVELPDTDDPHAPEVYQRGAANMKGFIEADYTVREAAPALYVYRVDTGTRMQTGIFGCVSVQDYDEGVIVKHEETRPDKVHDRARHMELQQAHAEPVMLTYEGRGSVDALVNKTVEREPLYDFQDGDTQHTLWRVETPETWKQAFADVNRLYIADGHHRCKAASRVAQSYAASSTDRPEAHVFPAVLFPMRDMHIMAYNRVLSGLGVDPGTFLDRLADRYTLERSVPYDTPRQKGHVCIYARGEWHDLTLPRAAGPRTVDTLDVTRLTKGVLAPILNVTNPRSDDRLGYVGGIAGAQALKKKVDGGEEEIAISMYPTAIEELAAVSDDGDLMPPKSTWFEPKLISGMLVHTF
ncbi:MAG: DUF1015 family protein [Longimonas sp.]|uniref:DUF1015 domain-containing protein n=1 Tax=Longimonas sp. TaxID=2039626 RepID=UPI00335FCF5B